MCHGRDVESALPASIGILCGPTFLRNSAMTVVTRFAPSPSGHLHVGGARTALFCWAFARGREGRFVLRIEDTDQKRSSEEASLGFMRDLAWLGMDWNEGPTIPELPGQGGGDHGPYFQSERLAIYQSHLDRLVDEGKAYHAFDTPEELDAKRKAARAAKEAYRYDRAALSLEPAEVAARLAAGEPSVIRFRSPDAPITIVDEVLGEATLPAGEVDDFVIRKADGYPTYHFAVVVDDALMKVSHVLRAQEHFNNTAKHILLQDALGFPRPNYGHLSLIMNPDGSKMSKRDKDKTLRAAVRAGEIESCPEDGSGIPIVDSETWDRWKSDKTVQLDLERLEAVADTLGIALPEINVADFRRSGYLPEVLCNFLSLNGWSAGDDLEKFDNGFLCENFDLDRVQKTPAKFDRDKLLAFNLDAIQDMAPEEFARRARIHAERFHPEFLARIDENQFAILCEASRERSKTLSEPFRTNRFLVLPDEAIEWTVGKPVRKAMFRGEPTGFELLGRVRDLLVDLEDFKAASLETVITGFAEEAAEGNLGRVAQPLRIAVSGGPVSPPIFDTLEILGRHSVIARIDRCREALAEAAELAAG
ncbi:MAG: glutamate--tRNA ligase [Planctomycetaceae bacterium]|nr:glutamate--tRNA ligase [Planctomycetaceae bacterium]